MANHLFDHIQMIRSKTIAFGQRPIKSLQEHLSIIAALENRDPPLAERRMREHIEGLVRHVEKNVSALP